jgi:hypothetical protein
MLGELLAEPEVDYVGFMRGVGCFEFATGSLAARLGVPVHLVDPFDVQDGDGALVVEHGEYKPVSLDGWFGVYYATAGG